MNEQRDPTAAFEEWFHDLLPLARRCAARFRPGADVDDLVAEAFARAYGKWPTVSQLPYRDAWLIRVVTNLAVDQARRRRLVWWPQSRRPDEADVAAIRLTMRDALAALPRRQREAVSLRYLADYSEADVSKALGISPNTVKRHLSRATAALRTSLGTDWKGDP